MEKASAEDMIIQMRLQLPIFEGKRLLLEVYGEDASLFGLSVGFCSQQRAYVVVSRRSRVSLSDDERHLDAQIKSLQQAVESANAHR